MDNNQTVDPKFQNPEQYGEGTNWFNAITRTAPMQNYSVSLNSSKDKLNTSIILGYFAQDGVLINTGFKRYSLRANVDYSVNKYLKFGANVAPNYQYTKQGQTDGDPFGGAYISGAILTSPLAPYKNADGSVPINASGYGSLDGPNYYNQLNTVTNNSKGTHILGGTFVEVTPIEGLSIKSAVNVDYSTLLYNNFTPSTAGGFFNPGNLTDASRIHAAVSNDLNYSLLWENTVNYKRSIGKHTFDVLAGYTTQYFRDERSNINASKFPDNLVTTINAATTITAGSDIQESSLISYLARANYNYDGKYLLTAAIRRDGSSRFGVDKRYGNFPSFSAGWIASEENFMKKIPVISNLKIRASYGTVGNNNIGNYTQYATVVGTNYPFNDAIGNGRSIAGLNNTQLGWEKSTEADLGLDISFLNNRINFSYDYYNKTTDNLLYSVNIPISSGFFNYITNIGKLNFWGHEFNINTRNLIGDFKWSTDFNISFNRNKVLQLGTANAALYGDLTITQVGQPIGQLYAFAFDGVAKNQADFDGSPKYVGEQVGMAKFKDINGDGVVTFDNRDKTVLGNSAPSFVYGITNRFAYKNFDLSIVLAGQYGNKLADRLQQLDENLDGAFNVTKDVANRWRSPSNPGDGRYGKDIGGTTSYERDNFSSRMFYDASFLTVKNITLGYDINMKNKTYIHDIRVFFSGQQLWVFTKYPGANPEASNTYGGGPAGVLSLGNDYSTYPTPRVFTIGANVNF